MKRSRTRSAAGKAPALASVATVQVPLPLLAVLADAQTAFFGLCLTAGQQVFQTLMEQDRTQLCGPKNVPDPARQAYRGGSAPSEVVLGGRRIVLPRLRARSVTGDELPLPSFAYASVRDPLDARTLEAIAIGVTTRKYHRALDPLPVEVPERAVSKSAVSRRFVALTSARLTTWLAMPLDALDIRLVLIDGLHFRDHVILLAVGVDARGTKHVLALREGTTENATVCKALLADLRQRGLDLDRPTLFIIDGGTPIRAPNANAHTERWVETVRAECLDWLLVLGRRHLDQVLRTYVDHYNRQRPHHALALAAPLQETAAPVPVRPRDVQRRDLLGGLIHEYGGVAA